MLIIGCPLSLVWRPLHYIYSHFWSIMKRYSTTSLLSKSQHPPDGQRFLQLYGLSSMYSSSTLHRHPKLLEGLRMTRRLEIMSMCACQDLLQSVRSDRQPSVGCLKQGRPFAATSLNTQAHDRSCIKFAPTTDLRRSEPLVTFTGTPWPRRWQIANISCFKR